MCVFINLLSFPAMRCCFNILNLLTNSFGSDDKTIICPGNPDADVDGSISSSDSGLDIGKFNKCLINLYLSDFLSLI